MGESHYPEKLKIYKEDNENQDHYLVIVDQDGNPVSSTEKSGIQLILVIYTSLFLLFA
tara:strand:- start:92 stop:265 length:174 start_codon:yes stop_codon:yes gene_type:complete